MAPPVPPPPPPPGVGPPAGQQLLPPHLQAMMNQMQKRQPKLQQQFQSPTPFQQPAGRGFRGGRGARGRGGYGRGGRGGRRFQPQQQYRQNQTQGQSQFRRKRGPSDDARDASRFFLPSMLEDPWRQLEAVPANGGECRGQNVQQEEELRPRHVQGRRTSEGRAGRVLFQPSFLENPWAALSVN